MLLSCFYACLYMPTRCMLPLAGPKSRCSMPHALREACQGDISDLLTLKRSMCLAGSDPKLCEERP